MCYGGIDLKHLQRETESRLAGLPKVDAQAALRGGAVARLFAGLRRYRAKGGLLLAALLMAGCVAGGDDRWPPEQQELQFIFNWAPKGTVCDATAAGIVTKDSDLLGAPRVTIKGSPQTAVITCTTPRNEVFVGAFAAGLPFGSEKLLRASAIYSAGASALPVDVRSADRGTVIGNGLVRTR
jgi:hypothetical protein